MNSEDSKPDMTLAAVCGLYCGACSLYIGTKEDPPRLKALAARFEMSEEEAKCHGCRSDKRFPHCAACKMSACSAERGIDFCSQCPDYPCGDLKAFQKERPHRIDLFTDLERLKEIGVDAWIEETRKRFACPKCGVINSAYDLKCRKCGNEPSCGYVERHGEAVIRFFAERG